MENNTPLTNSDYKKIGRTVAIQFPDLCKDIVKKYTPALTDLTYIPLICKKVLIHYPDIELYDQIILQIACVYHLYCPATLLGNRGCNAPANMRAAIANTLNYTNRTMINYYMDTARAFMKNPRFVKKVEILTAEFKTQNNDN